MTLSLVKVYVGNVVSTTYAREQPFFYCCRPATTPKFLTRGLLNEVESHFFCMQDRLGLQAKHLRKSDRLP